MAKKQKAIQYKGKCPNCKEGIIVSITEKVLKAAVKAEKEQKITFEKDSQTRLK